MTDVRYRKERASEYDQSQQNEDNSPFTKPPRDSHAGRYIIFCLLVLGLTLFAAKNLFNSPYSRSSSESEEQILQKAEQVVEQRTQGKEPGPPKIIPDLANERLETAEQYVKKAAEAVKTTFDAAKKKIEEFENVAEQKIRQVASGTTAQPKKPAVHPSTKPTEATKVVPNAQQATPKPNQPTASKPQPAAATGKPPVQHKVPNSGSATAQKPPQKAQQQQQQQQPKPTPVPSATEKATTTVKVAAEKVRENIAGVVHGVEDFAASTAKNVRTKFSSSAEDLQDGLEHRVEETEERLHGDHLDSRRQFEEVHGQIPDQPRKAKN